MGTMSLEDVWDVWNQSGGPKYPHEKVVQFVFRAFPRAARQGPKALDLGCGSGVHTQFLAAEGFQVHARDLSAVGVRNTLERLKKQGLDADVAVGRVERIDFPQDSFDLVICVGTLDCAGAVAFPSALREIVRVLKPGGISLLIFASDRDFRVKGANELGLHGFTDAEVEAGKAALQDALEAFWMDRYVTTYRNREMEQNDHLVTLKKALR